MEECSTHEEVFQDLACNFTKSNTPSRVFFTFFQLYKWYQIAQTMTYKNHPRGEVISNALFSKPVLGKASATNSFSRILWIDMISRHSFVPF